MNTTQTGQPPDNPAFEAKIRKARRAIIAEQIWVRLWALFALAILFCLLSLAGVWDHLTPLVHKVLLGVFGAAAAASLIHALWIRWPAREEAIRRIERVSGLPHRPASSYEDTLTASAGDPATQAIWSAHRARMAALMDRLRPGRPSPRTDRYDPFALRAALVLALVAGSALAGWSALDSLKAAIRIGDDAALSNQRLDAWITPPTYTGRPPVMLADGSAPTSRDAAPPSDGSAASKALEVPEKSSLIVRTSGAARIPLALEIWQDGAREPQQRIVAEETAGPGSGVTEVRADLMSSAIVKALTGGRELGNWRVTVTPDTAPGIALTKNPERTARGALKLTYFVQDDYGVASAEVKFRRKQDSADPSSPTAWARGEPLKGPRPPYSAPPRLSLRLPAANAKQGEAFTYHDIGAHPWAGQKVMMTLEATDVGGKTGTSPAVEIVLPERPFTKPLARALVEQRRFLIEDPRHADRVRTALDTLTLEPEGFIDDPRVYLTLRASMYRLERDRTRAGLDSVIEQLWRTALRIEDGNLSDAEKNLRDIQDQLAKALENGASDEEIQRLMQELRKAFQEFAEEMRKQNGDDNASGQDKDNQEMTSEELDRMMREMEDMAKNGLRDQAKDMLAQMRDLMERIEKGQKNAERTQQNKEMQNAIKKLGEAVGEQQDIMDDTFEEGRQQQQPGQGQNQMRQTQPGQKGQRGQGMQADRNGMNNSLGDNDGEMGLRERSQDGEGQGSARGPERRGQLAERQAQLREKVDAMRRDMQEKGLGDNEDLAEAAEAMEQAEDALREGDLDGANQQQSAALDQMRESAQQMAQQMQQQNGQQEGGQDQSDNGRDPLGRPQRSQGPDQGRSVKVPDQIEMQRAREVLEELRRRLGEANRPKVELDYLERLLRWY